MKNCILGTDMCGTSMKVGAFSKTGERYYLAQRKQIPIITREGHFYFDKEYQKKMLYEMLQEIVDQRFKILSIGIGSCGEAVYPVDKSGEVIDNAIAWYCTRTNEQLEEFNKKASYKEVFKICYLKPFYNYSAHKINWIKKYKPDIFERAACWLHVDGYVNYLLTGTKYIDYNQAGTTLLFDTKKRDWSNKLFELNGLRRDVFPEFTESGKITGFINKETKTRLRIKYDIPVSIGGHDTWCGFYALGLGINKESEYIPNFTGTAGLTNIGKFIEKKELLEKDPDYFFNNFSWVIPHTIPGIYHCRGNNTSNYGVLLEYIKKLFFKKDEKESWDDYYSRVNKMLESTTPGANGVGVYVSENDQMHAKDLNNINFLDLKLADSGADILRSAMEYLSLLDRKNLEKMERLSNQKKKILVFGGLSNDMTFMKIRASIMERDQYIPAEKEINVLGAAMFGGVGAAVYSDHNDAIHNIVINSEKVIKPVGKLVNVYRKIYNI